MREVDRRSGHAVAHSTISQVLSGDLDPTEKFCIGVAKGLGLPAEYVLRKAGHLPPAPGDSERLTLRELWGILSQMNDQELAEVRRYARFVATGGKSAVGSRSSGNGANTQTHSAGVPETEGQPT